MAMHTPGPWRVESYAFPGPDNSPGDAGFEIVADRPGYSAPRNIAGTVMQNADDDTGYLAEDEANARLMSAAPELFEALQYFAYPGDHTGRPSDAELRVKARAAIAKATGDA